MSAGAWIVIASVAGGLVVAFVLRNVLPAPVVTVALAACGVGIAWGGMLLRDDPPTWEVVAAAVLLAGLVPAHVRIVMGPFGPRR
ncbi:MAG TPA: hypothetical protein VFZ45_03785 [Actinomycetota bacterium]|nr:hypothetical protein [Actinomycetota bacterium]